MKGEAALGEGGEGASWLQNDTKEIFLSADTNLQAPPFVLPLSGIVLSKLGPDDDDGRETSPAGGGPCLMASPVGGWKPPAPNSSPI